MVNDRVRENPFVIIMSMHKFTSVMICYKKKKKEEKKHLVSIIDVFAQLLLGDKFTFLKQKNWE